MELVCVILVLVLGTCAAAPQDLRGKMFTFPEESETSFVKVDLDLEGLSAFTVCMRVFTDQPRPHFLFQLTTNSSYDPDNNFRVVNNPMFSRYRVSYNNADVHFNSNYYRINVWQRLCCSWAAQSGIAQLWGNGEPSSRKFLGQAPMKGPLAIIIGKSTMPHSTVSPFSGMFSDLTMWDSEIRPSQIQHWDRLIYGPSTNFPKGAFLSWQNLDFQIHGRVLVEDK